MNLEELAQTALKKWGRDAQLNMVIEECAELIDVIQKARRGLKTLNDILEEGVDVEIMLASLKLICGMPALWEVYTEQQLKRLEERL